MAREAGPKNDGRIRVGIGAVNPNDIQYYQEWHGMSNIEVDAELDLLQGGFTQNKPWCQGDQAICTDAASNPNSIAGFTGVYFPPRIPNGKDFRIWVPQVARAFDIVNPPAEREADGRRVSGSFNHRGIRLLRYGIAPKEFENGRCFVRVP